MTVIPNPLRLINMSRYAASRSYRRGRGALDEPAWQILLCGDNLKPRSRVLVRGSTLLTTRLNASYAQSSLFCSSLHKARPTKPLTPMTRMHFGITLQSLPDRGPIPTASEALSARTLYGACRSIALNCAAAPQPSDTQRRRWRSTGLLNGRGPG